MEYVITYSDYIRIKKIQYERIKNIGYRERIEMFLEMITEDINNKFDVKLSIEELKKEMNRIKD